MAKKKTWFGLIKRFFISEPHSRLVKGKDKDKRKRWVFGLLKMKEVAPLSVSATEILQWQTSEQSNCVLPQLQVGPIPRNNAQSAHDRHINDDSQESVESNSCAIIPEHERASQHQAATKIQAAFRGYLATKALGALKGVVKLQALIRGWAVRQKALNTLKCLQSIVNIQSDVCSKRCERIKDVKVDSNSQKRWEDSTLTKEELKALFLTKRNASMKRERVKEYYLNHRRSAETERDNVHGRRRYWLEQWVDAQLAKSDTHLDRKFSANARNRSYQPAEMLDSPPYIPRNMQLGSIGDDNNSFPAAGGSPAIPTYMASTESAKAKARSMSTPRLRPLSSDVCSDITSPYKHKLSPISSINSELITSTTWNHLNSSQRPPCLKGLPGPIKSTMSTKDLRIRRIYGTGATALTDKADSKGK